MSQMIKLPQQEMSVEALKALIAEAEAPRPIEGQVYRHQDATDAKPFTHTSALYRKLGGKWEWKTSEHSEWEAANWYPKEWDNNVRDLTFVPYTPPPPTFQVGQWVTVNNGSRRGKSFRVERRCADDSAFIDGDTLYLLSELRLATPEEIATATRIVPKVGMLLKRKSDGSIWRLWNAYGSNHLDRLDRADAHCAGLPDLSTEDYEVLPRYLIEGAEP